MLIKEHVNDLLADYSEMSRIREEGSPWQQDAIDQLGPVLKGMADHLTATIQHQRENPTHVNMPAFVDYRDGTLNTPPKLLPDPRSRRLRSGEPPPSRCKTAEPAPRSRTTDRAWKGGHWRSMSPSSGSEMSGRQMSPALQWPQSMFARGTTDIAYFVTL